MDKIIARIGDLQGDINGEDYKSLDDIDIYNLEEEWKNQPNTYKEWSRKLADAKNLVGIIEERIEIRKAKIDREVRRQPSKWNLDKATNEAIKSIYVLNNEHRQLVELLIEANYLVDVLFGVIISLEHRRDALREEEKLFLKNYYAEPELNSKERKEMERHEGGKYVREYNDRFKRERGRK